MKERPILFSGPMVRAILDGRKTQTRRVVKKIPAHAMDATWVKCHCPYGQVGDYLWVRETLKADVRGMFYPADQSLVPKELIPDDYGDVKETLPSMFMPRRFSRITLEIMGVRVERLHEISQTDIRREGGPNHSLEAARLGTKDAEYLLDYSWLSNAWDKINGKKYPWVSNPWVWVIEFRTFTDEKD
jgi:hypothetical protein